MNFLGRSQVNVPPGGVRAEGQRAMLGLNRSLRNANSRAKSRQAYQGSLCPGRTTSRLARGERRCRDSLNRLL